MEATKGVVPGLACMLCGYQLDSTEDRRWLQRRTTDRITIRFPGYVCPSCGAELVSDRSGASGYIGLVS